MSRSTFEFIKLSIEDKFRPAIDFKAPYAKIMLNEATKAAIEAMRMLVKNDPKGCMADDEILQNYIDETLKAPITHRCNGTYEYGETKCTMARHADGTFSGIGCGEPCSWIIGKSGHGEPPWQTLEGNIRRNPCEPDEGYKSK